MKKIVNIIVLILIIAIGGIYYFFGPNVFYGGPTKNTIIEVTRATMASSVPTEEQKALAQNATISPSGFCSKDDGKFACMVTITMPDGTTKDFIALLKKNDNGAWEATQ